MWVSERAGKRECLWQETLALDGVGNQSSQVRRVYRLTERTPNKHGHTLLLPEFVLEGWTTTLPEQFGAAEVIIDLSIIHDNHLSLHALYLQRVVWG